MKHVYNFTNYVDSKIKQIKEALDLSNEVNNTLELIKKNSTLPLLKLGTPSNNNSIPYIKVLQNILDSQGYNLDINGKFDEKTKQAVVDYQSSDGLNRDGVVGKDTWSSLLKLNDINITPKIVNVGSTKSTTTNNTKTDIKTNPEVKNTETTTPVNNGDFQFKDSNDKIRNFSELAKAPDSKGSWYNNVDTVYNLIIKNPNQKFIIELNKLISERKNGKDLISFMSNNYSKSLLGGRRFDIGIKAFDIITNFIIDPAKDAQIINFALDGVGTEDELLKTIINKRAKQTDDYKNKIASSYQEEYNESLIDALEDDLDTDNEDDRTLIQKIVPNYSDIV
jgi:hypothetical protein